MPLVRHGPPPGSDVGRSLAWPDAMCRARALALVACLVGFSFSAEVRAKDGSLFDGQDVLELTVEAPFDDLFANARDDDDYSVTGSVAYTDPATGRTIAIDDVAITTRGHTSRNASECDFPKLKLKFGPHAGDGLFEDIETLKVGTHCADRPDAERTPKYGRLANEKAPHREALVYRLLDAAQVPTLRARPARISYVFSGSKRTAEPPLIRNAMLLEDDDAALHRLGGAEQLTDDRFESAQAMFSPVDSARLAFAQAMIGNFDWCLRFFAGDTYRCDDTHPLWNVIAVVRKDGSAAPAIYDFDLSGIVVGRHPWFGQVLNEAFLPSNSRIEVEVLSQLQRVRSLYGRQHLDAMRRSFMDRKAAIFSALAEGVVDEEGRKLAGLYLSSFFNLIEDEAAFYRPVVVAADTRAYRDADRAQPACGEASVVPIGTPASAPLEVRGDMSRVLLLDAQWRWAPPRTCNAVRSRAVWIASDAIDTNYPR